MNSSIGTGILCHLAVGLALSICVHAQTNKKRCDQPPGSYEQNGYRVRDIRIDSPLAWLMGSVDQKLNEMVSDPSMPIKKGSLFHTRDLSDGFLKVKERFPELTVSKTARVALRIARPILENCDEQEHSLDVVFRVYTFAFSNYFSRAFETGHQDELQRSVVDTSATEKLANYFPQPLLGFNRTRSVYGGSKLSINQPNGFLSRITMAAIGSGSSDEEDFVAVGGHETDTGLIRHTDYRFGYHHSAVPASATKLKEGLGLAQFLGATRPLGSREFVLRFGASLEGGNKQTTVAPAQLLPGDVAQSPYGGLKLFAGATMRQGSQAFKASYGVEFGTASTAAQLDFVKQVFDGAANLRFLVKNHRTLTIDLQFTAGAIQNRGRVPVAELFFGGNTERNFIASSDWVIRSDPYIRSFPENTFAQTSAQTIVGGDRFFSANITAGITVWGKPLVPEQVLADPDFEKLVNFEFNSAQNALTISYLEETPEFRRVGEMVDPLNDSLSKIRSLLTDLSGQGLGDDINQQIQICTGDADDVDETITQIKSDLVDGSPRSADIRTLVVGFPNKPPPAGPIPSQVSDLLDDLTDLAAIAGIPGPQAITNLVQQMKQAEKAMATAFLEVTDPTKSAAARKAAERARLSMVYPRRVFRELSREANLIAVSPIVIFDSARLRQSPTLTGKVRYAMGGGLRVSIVSLDLTAGYAFNSGRLPWERRGAFLFSMEVSNLFR